MTFKITIIILHSLCSFLLPYLAMSAALGNFRWFRNPSKEIEREYWKAYVIINIMLGIQAILILI